MVRSCRSKAAQGVSTEGSSVHQHRRRFILLLLLLLAAVPARAHETRHVVIVVVDGARYSETFGDSTLANVPRMGRDLAPLGCRGASWNAGVTTTVPGHAAILSGVYQDLANDGTERPHLPLIFEYYRAATGAPRTDTWFLSAKAKLDVLSNSDDPAYGDSLGAAVDVTCPSDSAIVARTEIILRDRHPTIVAINLPRTDQVAHTGDWAGYLAALQQADSLVYDLWQSIQSDSVLAGHTTLFVTNDHGRHDDAHGGFTSHGCGCDGCRRVMLLALGPDFRAGFVKHNLAQPVDIAATVGELLGFPMPWSKGRVMADLFDGEEPAGVGPDAPGPRLRLGGALPNPTHGAVRVPLDAPRAGHLHVDVLDVQGRRVDTVADEEVTSGSHVLAWTGRTAEGRSVAPGTYYLRARLGAAEAATRVVVR
ncbi:MAG TPA: FlgD immunoglobulin-like domain containing protein [Thermoanaerobaculaceae bacterium]|nr:FlgD immunoglobulin-like domain containing protein [Thermoanaerobaculaceae bacterium]